MNGDAFHMFHVEVPIRTSLTICCSVQSKLWAHKILLSNFTETHVKQSGPNNLIEVQFSVQPEFRLKCNCIIRALELSTHKLTKSKVYSRFFSFLDFEIFYFLFFNLVLKNVSQNLMNTLLLYRQIVILIGVFVDYTGQFTSVFFLISFLVHSLSFQSILIFTGIVY